MADDRIEIDLSTLVFVGLCGDGALFEDGDGDEILPRATGNKSLILQRQPVSCAGQPRFWRDYD